MSWKVYDAMESPGYSRAAGGDVYGPLPCKRWIPDVPYRKYKLAYRFQYAQSDGQDADSYNERHAIAYAKWLAARDGITLPPTISARVIWSGFYSKTKTRGQRHWTGEVRKHASYCKRVMAVEFGRKFETDHYSTRKDGRRGAFSHRTHEMDVAARIEIPNWDWEPQEPIEEIIPDRLCA